MSTKDDDIMSTLLSDGAQKVGMADPAGALAATQKKDDEALLKSITHVPSTVHAGAPKAGGGATASNSLPGAEPSPSNTQPSAGGMGRTPGRPGSAKSAASASSVRISASLHPKSGPRAFRKPATIHTAARTGARYHKAELMDDVDRTELLYCVQGENMDLKKHNLRLQKQNKQLEVRFANIQKDMLREGFAGVAHGLQEIEKLGRQLEKRGAGSGTQQTRQGPQSVRQVGGALRRRLSPNVFAGTRAMSPVDDEMELMRRTVTRLTAENEALRTATQAHGALDAANAPPPVSFAVSPRTAQSAKELNEEREQLLNDKMDLMRRFSQLEKEKLEVESELRHLKAFDEKSNILHWKRKVAEYEENNKQLLAKVNALTKNAFLGTADSRAASGRQLEEMETSLKKLTALNESLTKDKEQLEQEVVTLKKQNALTSDKYRELLEDNERCRVRLEEKDKQVAKVENQVRYLHQSLPAEERDALQRALHAVIEESPASFATLDSTVMDRWKPIASTPEAALTRVIDKLRSEKDALAQELGSTKQLLVRESAIGRDLKELNRKDNEDMQQRLQMALADKDKWEHIARAREKRLKELQRTVDSIRHKDIAGYSQLGVPLDVVSESGFTDVSELKGTENALDIILSVGRIEESALERLPKADGVLSAATVMTCITIDFFEFDSACSEVGSSLRPNYNSIVSFTPFVVDDFFLDYISGNNSMKLELQAFVVGSRVQHVIGVAHWELVDLMITPTIEKPNPMHTGVLRFVALDDPSVLVAEVPYKIKLRYAILDAVVDYMAKHDLKTKQLTSLPKPLDVDPILADSYRNLRVRLFQVTGLARGVQGVYCFYEIPGYPQIFTQTVRVNNGVAKIADDSLVNVLVDAKFQEWAQGQSGGLRILLFDEQANPQGSQEESLGLLGEVALDLKHLLHNWRAVLEGSFAIRKDARSATSAQVGSLEVSVSWIEKSDTRLAPEKQSHLAQIPGAGSLNPDYFATIMLRLTQNIDLRKLTVNDWFAQADLDRDGFLSQDEFLFALARASLGLSSEEMRDVWNMVDKERAGKVSPSAFSRCLSEGAKMSSLEVWAKDLVHRVVQAMRNAKLDPRQAFENISINYLIQRPAFTDLLTQLNLQLTSQDIDRLWNICDRNNDGFINYNEFTNRFGLGTAQTPVTSSYTLPTGKSDAPRMAEKMSDSYYEICLGRIIRQFNARGIHDAARAFDAIDKNRDGKLKRQELIQAFTDLHVGLSEWEQVQIYERLDPSGEGSVLLESFSAALKFADLSTAMNKESFKHGREIFARIGGSIQRSGKSLREVYEALGSDKGISKSQFCKVVVTYDPNLTAPQLDSLWEIVDKNRDGTIDFAEFESILSPAALQTPGADRMSQETFALIMSKVHKKLASRGFTTIEGAFQAIDSNQDGALSPDELNNALKALDLGLSAAERKMVLDKMDYNKDGKMSIMEFQNALLNSDVQGSSADAWARDIITRIQKAILRVQGDVRLLYDRLAPQKDHAMTAQQFTTFVLQFQPGLSEAQLKRLWHMVDKNNDGGVSFEEFQERFTPHAAAAQTPRPISTARSIASSADEDLTICQHIQRRAEVCCEKNGKGLAELMKEFDATKTDTLDMKSFVSFINSLSIGLSVAEIETFFKKFDPDGVAKVKIADFVHTVDRKTAKLEAWAQALLGRVSSSIARANQPLPDIFKKFCGGNNTMKKPQFSHILRAFEKDLSQRHIDHLWNLVDKDQSGDIDVAEFREIFDVEESKAEGLKTQTIDKRARRASYAARLWRYLQQKGTDIRSTFVLYDEKVESALDFSKWRNAIEQEGLGLSSSEAEWLFWNIEDGNANPDKIRFEALESLRVDAGPFDGFARDFIVRIDEAAKKQNTTLFARLHPFGDAIEQEALRNQLQLSCPVSDEQWARLVLVMDKRHDDRVAWVPFLNFILSPSSAPEVSPTRVQYSDVQGLLSGVPSNAASSNNGLASTNKQNMRWILSLVKKKMDDKKMDARQVFSRNDFRGVGALNKADMERLLSSMSLGITMPEIHAVFDMLDANKNGSVSYDEWWNAVVASASEHGRTLGKMEQDVNAVFTRVREAVERRGQSVRDVFQQWAGWDSASNAYCRVISRQKFFDMLRHFSPSLSEDEETEVMHMVDKDQSGNIDYDEFCARFGAKRSASSSSFQVSQPRNSSEQQENMARQSHARGVMLETSAASGDGSSKQPAASQRPAPPSTQPVPHKDQPAHAREHSLSDEHYRLIMQRLAFKLHEGLGKQLVDVCDRYAHNNALSRANVEHIFNEVPTGISQHEQTQAIDRLFANNEDAIAPAVFAQAAAQGAVPKKDFSRFFKTMKSANVLADVTAHAQGRPSLSEEHFTALNCTDLYWAVDKSPRGSVNIASFVAQYGPKKSTPTSASAAPSAVDFSVDTAIMHIRSLLAIKKMTLDLCFRQFDTHANSYLSEQELTAGLKTLGCDFTELQYHKLYQYLASHDLGASIRDFQRAFKRTGPVFESYAFSLIRRVASDVLREKDQDITSAFQVFDKNNNGTISKYDFTTVLMAYDLNLDDEQLTVVWDAVRDEADTLSFPQFKKLFDVPTVVQFTDAMRTWTTNKPPADVVEKRFSDVCYGGRLSRKLFFEVVQSLLPRMTVVECEQLLRVAPFCDGAFDSREMHDVRPFLSAAADTSWATSGMVRDCHDLLHALSAKRFQSLNDLIRKTVPANATTLSCTDLRTMCETQLGPNVAAMDSLLRLGAVHGGSPSKGGTVNIAEVCENFRALTSGSNLVTSEQTVPGRAVDAVKELEGRCPVVLTAPQVTLAAGKLREQYPDGVLRMDELVRLLEASGVTLEIRDQDRLKGWLPPRDGKVFAPPLLAFHVTLEKFVLKGNSAAREFAHTVRVSIGLGDARLSLPPFAATHSTSSIGSINPFSQKSTHTAPHWYQRAEFYLDGPHVVPKIPSPVVCIDIFGQKASGEEIYLCQARFQQVSSSAIETLTVQKTDLGPKRSTLEITLKVSFRNGSRLL